MEKLLVGLNVPSVRQHYDIFVPQDTDIGTLTKVLADGVAQLSDGRYIVSGMEMLTQMEPDMLLHPARRLMDYGIEDGAQLVLL